MTRVEFPFGETCTIVRAGVTTDPFSGEATQDWDNPVETTVPTPCAVYASIITESNLLGDIATPLLVLSTLTAVLPYGSDITETDVLRIDTGPYASSYNVKAVKAWKNVFTGWAPGVEVRLELGEVRG